MIAAQTAIVDNFGAVLKGTLERAADGLEAMAEDVQAEAYESMPVHGRKPSDPGYEHAPAGEPPYSHTERFRESLAIAADGDKLLVGTTYSEVGLRGTWFEFGGRPNTKSKGARNWKPHPFIGPALDRQVPKFARRVAEGE